MKGVVYHLPATKRRLKEIKKKQDIDPVYEHVKHYCLNRWLTWGENPLELKQFLLVLLEFSIQEELLLHLSRLVILKFLRSSVLEKIHAGHLGITKYQGRAGQAVWWPEMSQDNRNSLSVPCLHTKQRAKT